MKNYRKNSSKEKELMWLTIPLKRLKSILDWTILHLVIEIDARKIFTMQRGSSKYEYSFSIKMMVQLI